MTPWVTRLLIANVVMFFITRAFRGVEWLLAFIPAYALERPWTLVTYMFLHASLPHLFFNMVGLFFFGPRLETRLGARHFLWLYFVSGVVGALLSIPFTPGAIVGASGALFGVFLGFARYWPREKIYIWGVLPIQAWAFVAFMTVASLGSGITGTNQGVAHFAHLGGFLGGFLYLKWLELRSPARRFKRKAQPAAARRTAGSRRDIERWRAIRRDDLHEVNRAELDRLLDKIGAAGVRSLTPDERAWLDRFSAG